MPLIWYSEPSPRNGVREMVTSVSSAPSIGSSQGNSSTPGETGAGEDDVGHGAAAQVLGALLSHDLGRTCRRRWTCRWTDHGDAGTGQTKVVDEAEDLNPLIVSVLRCTGATLTARTARATANDRNDINVLDKQTFHAKGAGYAVEPRTQTRSPLIAPSPNHLASETQGATMLTC